MKRSLNTGGFRVCGLLGCSLLVLDLAYAQPPDRAPNEVVISLRVPALRAPNMAPDNEKTGHALHQQATVGGKYRMLLEQIAAPEAQEKEGRFRDAGQLVDAPVATSKIKNAHWVYAAPYWFAWRDLADTPLPRRSWGPEQVIGKPNTETAGDLPTAWASRGQDDAEEWLLLQYDGWFQPSAIRIHETYNPGAVRKVSVFALNGEEIPVFEGNDPLLNTPGKGVFELKFKTPFLTNRVKITLDSAAVPGWNEIDAVALVDDDGATYWASAVAASSTYAETGRPEHLEILGGAHLVFEGVDNIIEIPEIQPLNQRVQHLEEEVRRLKQQVNELQGKLPQAAPPNPLPLPPLER